MLFVQNNECDPAERVPPCPDLSRVKIHFITQTQRLAWVCDWNTLREKRFISRNFRTFFIYWNSPSLKQRNSWRKHSPLFSDDQTMECLFQAIGKKYIRNRSLICRVKIFFEGSPMLSPTGGCLPVVTVGLRLRWASYFLFVKAPPHLLHRQLFAQWNLRASWTTNILSVDRRFNEDVHHLIIKKSAGRILNIVSFIFYF